MRVSLGRSDRQLFEPQLCISWTPESWNGVFQTPICTLWGNGSFHMANQYYSAQRLGGKDSWFSWGFCINSSWALSAVHGHQCSPVKGALPYCVTDAEGKK